MFCAGDECFSAGNECIENTLSSFRHTHPASYQQLSNRTYLEIIVTHRHSPLKTGGSYHAFVLTSVYATPTRVIYTVAFSAGLNSFQVD